MDEETPMFFRKNGFVFTAATIQYVKKTIEVLAQLSGKTEDYLSNPQNLYQTAAQYRRELQESPYMRLVFRTRGRIGQFITSSLARWAGQVTPKQLQRVDQIFAEFHAHGNRLTKQVLNQAQQIGVAESIPVWVFSVRASALRRRWGEVQHRKSRAPQPAAQLVGNVNQSNVPEGLNDEEMRLIRQFREQKALEKQQRQQDEAPDRRPDSGEATDEDDWGQSEEEQPEKGRQDLTQLSEKTAATGIEVKTPQAASDPAQDEYVMEMLKYLKM